MSEKADAAMQLVKISAASGVWLGLQLADLQVFVSIFSGLAVAAYTLVNLYVLWRDKIKRDKYDAG